MNRKCRFSLLLKRKAAFSVHILRGSAAEKPTKQNKVFKQGLKLSNIPAKEEAKVQKKGT
jgi:hypothetical protein